MEIKSQAGNFSPSPFKNLFGRAFSVTLMIASLLMSWPSEAEAYSSSAHCVSARSGKIQKAELYDTHALEPGVSIEREIGGGKLHRYRITMASGQYLRVVVEQRDSDLAVKFLGPDGQQLDAIYDSDGERDSLPVMFVAEAGGDYRIEVRARSAARGHYKVKVEELRAALPEDISRIAAEKVFAEGERLRRMNKAESKREAIRKYEEAISLFQASGDRPREAASLNNIGFVHRALSEYENALTYYEKALRISREVADSKQEATAYNNMGLVFRILGDYQKALSYYDQALLVCRAIGDRRREAGTLNNIGSIYYFIGEPGEALSHFNRAAAIFRSLDMRDVEALLINNLGVIHSSLGEPEKALDHYGRALEIFHSLNDRAGEVDALLNITSVRARLGENQKAIEVYNQALSLSRATGNRQREALTLNNFGQFYYTLGDYQRAMDYYNQSLDISQSIGNRRQAAITLNNIGLTEFASGEDVKALQYYKQALELQHSIEDRLGETSTLNNIGAAYDKSGEYEKAMDYYNRAASLCRDVGNRLAEAQALHNIGNVHRRINENQRAMDYYNRALKLKREVMNREGEASLLLDIANLARDLGNTDESRASIKSAIAVIESLRANAPGQELRASFLASRKNYYEFYIDLLMQSDGRTVSQEDQAAALQASEMSRARSLLETLAESRADIRQGVAPELLERERRLQQRLGAKEQYRMRLLRGRQNAQQMEASEKEIRDILTEYQQVQAEIRINSPQYAALTRPDPLGLKEIQQQVLDSDTLLLEYALASERSYLWAITPASITSYALPGREEIEFAARRVYELLTARNKRVPNETSEQRRARLNQADSEYMQAAYCLSRMLIGPVAEQLGKKRLLIVSEGVLQYIPFGALPKPEVRGQGSGVSNRKAEGRKQKAVEGDATSYRLPTSDLRPLTPDFRPLIVEHEIVHLPSASVLAMLRREMRGRKPGAKAVAVVADPVFALNDPRVLNRSGKNTPLANSNAAVATRLERPSDNPGINGFKRLRFSRQEADAIAALVPAEKNLLATDFAASRATVTSANLAQYRILHFATHGLLNSKQPELSGIVLSLVDQQGQYQDGFLRLHEIYNLKLRADLVVLSACRTALGKEIKGEGLVGLVRGFMYAGAPRVVASLWNVEDRATAELMKRFYREMLSEGMTAAAALRVAQVSMWKEKRWQKPYYWAGFTLQGEWR